MEGVNEGKRIADVVDRVKRKHGIKKRCEPLSQLMLG